MKRIWFLLFLICLMFFSSGNAQPSSNAIKPLDLSVGIGIGNKSHLGTLGFTSNLYATSRISAKVSLGIAAGNYGRGMVSGGLEYIGLRFSRSHLSVGSCYSLVGRGQDILGDDDSNDYVWYFTSQLQCIRSWISYSLVREGYYISFEAGWSQTISPYSFSFGGPGVPTEKQKFEIDRALRSGWMATISANGLFSLRKKKV